MPVKVSVAVSECAKKAPKQPKIHKAEEFQYSMRQGCV